MPHPAITTAGTKMQDALTHLDREFAAIRTGRAHPGLVENIMVESYGSKVPLKTIASINASDKSTITIQPWDKSIVGAVERALREASLGAQPVSDGHTIRLPLPSPTEEQRKELCKKAHSLAEEARISVRTARTDAHGNLRKLKDASEITEDDFFTYDKELQKVVDGINENIQKMTEHKEKEIMTV